MLVHRGLIAQVEFLGASAPSMRSRAPDGTAQAILTVPQRIRKPMCGAYEAGAEAAAKLDDTNVKHFSEGVKG